jgi:hypothetical protein
MGIIELGSIHFPTQGGCARHKATWHVSFTGVHSEDGWTDPWMRFVSECGRKMGMCGNRRGR